MVALVTLELTKEFLRVDFPDDDDVLNALIAACSDYVINYLKDQADEVLGLDSGGELPSGTEIPEIVQVATMLWVQHIYDQRGTEMDGAPLAQGYPPMVVVSLLHPLRDPALR